MAEDKPDSITFRRILVALDTSRHSRAALETAAELAELSRAEIRGLFVQDAYWYKLGKLSFISEVSELTGTVRPIQHKNIEEQIRVLEYRVKRMMQEIIGKSEIPHTWETTRGTIEDEILAAAEEADLITIGRAGHSKKKKLGRTAQTIIERADKPVLLLKEGLTLGHPVVVVYDGSSESQHGLEIALSLARKIESKLIVIALKNDPSAVRSERDKGLEQVVDDSASSVEVIVQKSADIGEFTASINRKNCGLLVISKNQPILGKISLSELMNLLACPILLMN